MSHFMTVVILPSGSKDVNLLDGILAPYSANIAVNPYMSDCYCIGALAHEEVLSRVESVFCTISELRAEFAKTIRPVIYPLGHELAGISKQAKRKTYQKFVDRERQLDEEWDQFIKEPSEFYYNELAEHPLKDAPNPECKLGCGGTGKVATTRNPKSKWDWYESGGRYTGFFSEDYDPEEDPVNIGKCGLCNGTGLRMDEAGIETRRNTPDYTCNGCAGKGLCLKSCSKWKQYPGDVMSVKKFRKGLVPFAIITPNGLWHEKGLIPSEFTGFFKASRDEESKWNEECKRIFKKYRNYTAVNVDCHI